jgi:hypothetical protein
MTAVHEAACTGNLPLPGWPDFTSVLSEMKSLKLGGNAPKVTKDS